MPLTPEIKQKIETLIASDEVVLFMKGSRSFPQCGFSARVVNILNTLIPKYTTVNVLSDPDIRDGIKIFSDWPTIPQLYVRGELVGGADIVGTMHENGELQAKLGVAAKEVAPPKVTITAKAAEQLRAALGDGAPGDVIHLTIDGGFEHSLDLGPREGTGVVVESAGVTVQLDRASAARADGVSIDFIDGPSGAGFKIENPNRPPGVREIGPRELKELLDTGGVKELFDVRTARERDIAVIAGSRLLDDAALAHIEGLAKDTPIAFFCHHGGRSQNAAQHFLEKGFSKVYNLAGGVDAWSQQVDPAVKRY